MRWQDLVKTVAPTIGTALGGPVAGIATKFIADKLLGNGDATEDQVSAAILGATPDQLIKLKQLDNDFKLQMKQLDIDVYKMELNDVASARLRQTRLHDITPTILAIVFVTIYLIFSFIAMIKSLFAPQVELFIANLTNIVMLIMSYYFGSSSDTKIKNLTNLNK